MGRPPSSQGRRGGDAIYSPLWLTGERQPTKKQFVVPIPPVDPSVHIALQRRLAMKQPWLVQRARQLEEAESQLVELREIQEEASVRLQDLLEERAQALEKMEAALRQERLEQSLVELERTLRQNFQQEQARKQVELNSLCEELLKQEPPTVKEESEQEHPTEGEEEPPAKRLKVDHDEGEVDKEEPKVEEELEDGELEEEKEEGQIVDDRTPCTTNNEVKLSQLKKQELEVGVGMRMSQCCIITCLSHTHIRIHSHWFIGTGKSNGWSHGNQESTDLVA